MSLYWTEAIYRSYWAGVAEEAYFRGYLLPEMVEYAGPVFGIGMNIFLFSLLHYRPGNNLLMTAISYLPISTYLTLLSYANGFDFRKAAFVHFWYDIAIQAIYMLTEAGIEYLADVDAPPSPLRISFTIPL